MRIVRLLLTSTALCAMALSTGVRAQDRMNPSRHVMIEEAQVEWHEGPPSLNRGLQVAVLAGKPGEAGPFVMRLRMPAGYRIAPHWHPTDENVTVLSGTIGLGRGDTFDEKATKPLSAGGYALLPAEMRHFVWTKDGATIQLHGIGPFVLNYVNPADDPRKAATK
jgi:quercetin dioxygenase-like cupin family protein